MVYHFSSFCEIKLENRIYQLDLNSFFFFHLDVNMIAFILEQNIFFILIFLIIFLFFIFRNSISSLKPIFKSLAYIRIREFRPSHQDTESDTRFNFDVTQISLRRARLSEVMYMRRCYGVSNENEVG